MINGAQLRSFWLAIFLAACSSEADEGLKRNEQTGLPLSGFSAPGAGTQAQAGSGTDPLLGSDNPEQYDMTQLDLPEMKESCARTDITASRILPSVMLLVDGSQIMTMAYGDPPTPDGGVANPGPGPVPGQQTRWAAIREALVNPTTGVVPSLEGLVRFGLAVYGTVPVCPLPLGTIDPMLNNYQAINGGLPIQPPGLTTPTGVALDEIVNVLPDPKTSLDTTIGPQIIILATDGDPNDCGGGGLFGGGVMTNYAPSIAAATRAKDKNLRMYVISVGNEAGEQHLQEMANLGAGLDQFASPGAQVYYPEDPVALADTLQTLIGAELSCELALDGKGVMMGYECMGTVTLNGQELECNGADGWKLNDPTHIELQGAACEKFKNATDAALNANFPCELLLD